MNLPRNLQAGLISLVGVIVVGTAGFMLLSDLGFGESIYLSIVTITTLGFAPGIEPLTGIEKTWLVIVLAWGLRSTP